MKSTITKHVMDRLNIKMDEMEERICGREDRTTEISLSNKDEIAENDQHSLWSLWDCNLKFNAIALDSQNERRKRARLKYSWKK